MNVGERDDLLTRLDERSESIIRELKAQTGHLAKLNGETASNSVLSGKNRIHICIQWWVISILLLGSTLKIIGVY